jgi:hypothetical protein
MLFATHAKLARTDKFCIMISGRSVTVDAMEVLIKYCTNSFPQVDQFI